MDDKPDQRALNNSSSLQTANDPDEVVYPGRMRLFTIYGGLLLATSVLGFDSNCVAIVIPVITDELHSLNNVGWYATHSK